MAKFIGASLAQIHSAPMMMIPLWINPSSMDGFILKGVIIGASLEQPPRRLTFNTLAIARPSYPGRRAMGKRSSGKFERNPRDFYPTPLAAVPPLIPHLRGVRTFAEPCAGDGALVRHLESFGLRCVYAGDAAAGQDALALGSYGDADAIVTNPPYERRLMHALIEHFARILPTWLLLETDWASTKQAAPFLPSCSDIVSIGRLRWIEGTTMSGMQNFAWYRFDHRHQAGPIFHAHGLVPVSSRISLCAQCGKPYRPQRSDTRYCGDTCRQRAHRQRLVVTKRDSPLTSTSP